MTHLKETPNLLIKERGMKLRNLDHQTEKLKSIPDQKKGHGHQGNEQDLQDQSQGSRLRGAEVDPQ